MPPLPLREFRGILGKDMADKLWITLMRFHREVVMPDVERIVGESVGALRNEMFTNFDAVYKRFDRLESEFEEMKSRRARREARVAPTPEAGSSR